MDENWLTTRGDIGGNRDNYTVQLRHRYNWLPEALARRYTCTYGSHSELISVESLGEHFGHGLYEAE